MTPGGMLAVCQTLKPLQAMIPVTPEHLEPKYYTSHKIWPDPRRFDKYKIYSENNRRKHKEHAKKITYIVRRHKKKQTRNE